MFRLAAYVVVTAFLMLGYLLVSSAAHAQVYPQQPPPRGSITVHDWGNGMSTMRDRTGTSTIQDWGNGMTTIREPSGNTIRCQNWGNGMTTCN